MERIDGAWSRQTMTAPEYRTEPTEYPRPASPSGPHIQDSCDLSSEGKRHGLHETTRGQAEEDASLFRPSEEEDTSVLRQCLDRLERKKEEMEKKPDKEQQKWVFVKKLDYSPGKHMMRLARLYRVTDVRKFISGVNANIYLAKNDKGVDKAEVKTAVAQMQQVIQRARVKIKHMDREALEASYGKSALKRQELERALAIAHELKRKMVARKAREYGEAKSTFRPQDIIGTGRTPQERWEDTFQQRPQELAGTLSAPTLPQVTGPSQPTTRQAALIAQAAALGTGGGSVSTGGVDVYI